jgi:hypothetical protein
MKELTIIKVLASGRTEPPVPSGTDILLIQDGTVQVGRLLRDPDDTASICIDHPENQTDLDIRATQTISEQKPEYLKSKVALIVTCSADISKDMIW